MSFEGKGVDRRMALVDPVPGTGQGDTIVPRVLIVTNMYPSSGNPALGAFIRRQVDALRQLGCELEVLVIEGWKSKWNYLQGIRKVRQEARNGRFDIIHAFYGLTGFVCACQSALPLVVTYCGSDLNPGYAGPRKAPILSRLVIAMGQIAAWRSSACIVRSKKMKQRLLLARVRNKTSIVTSGVDLEIFHPVDRASAASRLGWSGPTKRVLFVCSDGSFPAVKRRELARATVAEAKKHISDLELIEVSGKRQEELNDLYNAADALLLTSAQEGSPNVVREALACNLPVVSTDVGDISDLVAGLANCHVGPPEPAILAEKLVEVLVRAERVNSRSRMEGHTVAHCAKAVLDIYGSVLRKRRGARLESKVGLRGLA